MKAIHNDAGFSRELENKKQILEVAAGRRKADLVLKNATYVNVFCNELSRGDIAVANGLIAGIGDGYQGEKEIDVSGMLVLPGFIDAHIHLESSLVAPAEFVKAVLPHGTTTVVTDPHEIANVMGADGIEYILQATEGLPVDVRVMLPSCVPATPLDESGAQLDYRAIDPFYGNRRVLGLAEMMNFPGVLNGDRQVLEKIVVAQDHQKLIDGHAPALAGKNLNAYVSSGVYSDHECSGLEEALEKMARGQSIMIREGTAAHNLDALMGLLHPKTALLQVQPLKLNHPRKGDILPGVYVRGLVAVGYKGDMAVGNTAQRGIVSVGELYSPIIFLLDGESPGLLRIHPGLQIMFQGKWFVGSYFQ